MTGSTVAALPGPVTRSYAYDGDGLLRGRSEGTSTTSYLWDSASAPAPLLVAGTDRVVHGLGPLYLARADGTTLTLVRDALGSVRAEVTDAGVIAKAFRYAAYGEIVQPNPNTPTLLGYAGELRDPSGLLYLRARWCDPGTGRFTSRDSVRGQPDRPVTLNLFSYADANPVRFVDPTGNCPFCLVMAVGAVAGATINASIYTLAATQSGDFTWGGMAGAAVTGAIIGGIAPIAGPAGGSFGALTTIAVNAGAGAIGYTSGGVTSNVVNSLSGGRADWSPTWSGPAFTALGAVVGGAVGEAVSPMVGVHTLRQLPRFAPRSWQGFMRQSQNVQALEGSAGVGALYGGLIALPGEGHAK